MANQELIPGYISRIRDSGDVDEQVRLVHELNELLPEGKRLQFPSLLTRDYICKAVDNIQEM